MRDLLSRLDGLLTEGPVGRAVVVRTWGSAPRPEGSVMLGTTAGAMAGSVSGGCVEASVLEAIIQAIRSSEPRLIRYTVTDARAWEVGLSCGGTVEVLVEPSVRAEVLAAARDRAGGVVATVIDGAPIGPPPSSVEELLRGPMAEAAERGRSEVVAVPGPAGALTVFLEVVPPVRTLVIVGAVHVAQALVTLAAPLGYRTIVVDGREALLTRDRFPEASELMAGWPAEVLPRLPLDRATAVCVLSHDPRFDEPAIAIALRSEAGYVGAIGSRATQHSRRERLRAEGFTDAQLERLHGPIGLDLGGRQAGEIALAILAEITAVRHGRGGRPRST